VGGDKVGGDKFSGNKVLGDMSQVPEGANIQPEGLSP